MIVTEAVIPITVIRYMKKTKEVRKLYSFATKAYIAIAAILAAYSIMLGGRGPLSIFLWKKKANIIIILNTSPKDKGYIHVV